MKKKFTDTIGFAFGLVGFLLILGGVGHMEIDSSPGAFTEGLLVASIGVGIFILLMVGKFLHNRS